MLHGSPIRLVEIGKSCVNGRRTEIPDHQRDLPEQLNYVFDILYVVKIQRVIERCTWAKFRKHNTVLGKVCVCSCNIVRNPRQPYYPYLRGGMKGCGFTCMYSTL